MIYLKKLSGWDGFVDFVKSDEYAGDIIAWDGSEGVYYNDATADGPNPELMEIAKSAGWVDASATTLPFRTCFNITTEQFNNANVIVPDNSAPNGYDVTFKNLTSFNEFQYFLSVTALTWTSNGDTADTVYHGSFFNATNLESVILPEGLILTENNTFMHCGKLKYVGVPSTIKQFGRNCFLYCNSLRNLELPEGLNVIGANCFRDTRLGQDAPLILPSTLTFIDYCACICHWNSLFNETLNLPRLRNIQSEVFFNNIGPRHFIIGDRLETICGGPDYTQHYNECFWNSLETVTIDENNPNFKTVDNMVFSKDGKYCYGGADYGLSTQERLEIPEGTEILVSGAFRTLCEWSDGSEYAPWCSLSAMTLNTIVIPSTITRIGYNCFQYCGWHVRGSNVICRATTPPKLLWPGGFFASAVGYFYVPDESVEAYKASTETGWSTKRSRIKPLSEFPQN